LAKTTHNDVSIIERARGASKCVICGRGEETKKGQKLSCVKLAIRPDHPRRYIPLKICMRGRVRELVIYFKFHEYRLRGLAAVGGRKSLSPIDLAYGSYYRTSSDIIVVIKSNQIRNFNVARITGVIAKSTKAKSICG